MTLLKIAKLRVIVVESKFDYVNPCFYTLIIVVYPWRWSNIYCWPRLLDLQDMRNVTQLLLRSFMESFFWKEQPNNFFLIHFAMEYNALNFCSNKQFCTFKLFLYRQGSLLLKFRIESSKISQLKVISIPNSKWYSKKI